MTQDLSFIEPCLNHFLTLKQPACVIPESVLEEGRNWSMNHCFEETSTGFFQAVIFKNCWYKSAICNCHCYNNLNIYFGTMPPVITYCLLLNVLINNIPECIMFRNSSFVFSQITNDILT